VKDNNPRLLAIVKAVMFTESMRTRMTTTAEIASVFTTLYKKHPSSKFARDIVEAFGPLMTTQKIACDEAFEVFVATAHRYGYIPGPDGDISIDTIFEKYGKN